MLSEAQTKSVALFFFFAFLDDKAAFQSTVKVIEKCRRRLTQSEVAEADVPVILVNLMARYFLKKNSYDIKSKVAMVYEAGWLVPTDVDLGVWQEFKKAAEIDEYLAVIWSKILNLDDSIIAKGLGVSVGTLRHRVGRGLRVLGHLRTREKLRA